MAHGPGSNRTPLPAAVSLLLSHTREPERERVKTEDALGRVTSEPVRAAFSSPYHRVSAMDGIAVRTSDCRSASAQTPLLLTATDNLELDDGGTYCRPVDTGNALPEWADAVIRIEDTKRNDQGFEVVAPVAPGKDVRRSGEDIDAGTTLLPAGHTIRPWDMGAMLACGVNEVAVAKRPRVAMLATGGEVVEPGSVPEPGQVIEFNSRIMAGFVSEWGGTATYLGRASDEESALAEAIANAARDNDVVCVIAGSSAGSKDFTVDALSRCGEVLARGVAIMPGRPALIAVVGEKPVIGIPGYPVSAVVVYQQLLRPLVCALLGKPAGPPESFRGRVKRKIASRLGVEEFLRVCVCRHGGEDVISPLPRGAGSISSVTRADGILRIPDSTEGIDAGTEVSIELLRPAFEAGNSVVVAGRPDAFSESLPLGALPHARLCHLGLGGEDALLSVAAGESHLAVLGFQESVSLDELKQRAGRIGGGGELLAWVNSESNRAAGLLCSSSFAAEDSGKWLVSALMEGPLPDAVCEAVGTGATPVRAVVS